MSWHLYPIDQFETYHNHWDALNSAHRSLPILEARFVRLTLKYFGDGREILAVYKNQERCLAMAILIKDGLGSWRTFQAQQSPLGAWIQNPSEAIPPLLAALCRTLSAPVWQLGLTQQDPMLYQRPPHNANLDSLDYIETAKITVAASFEDYWSARGKNLKQNMNRQRNRLERENVATRLEMVTDPAAIPAAIKAYAALETAGWKSESGTAISADNDQGRFYTDLLQTFCSSGNGRIYQYWYGQDLVATDICIDAGGTLVVLKTTYDEGQTTSSPALLMRRIYFEEIFTNKSFAHIEFYGKVMTWHTKWSDEFRTLYHVNYFPNPVLHWLKSLKRRLLKR